jgi:hypothetical protein
MNYALAGRKEGESCFLKPGSKEGLCERGLICEKPIYLLRITEPWYADVYGICDKKGKMLT